MKQNLSISREADVTKLANQLLWNGSERNIINNSALVLNDAAVGEKN